MRAVGVRAAVNSKIIFIAHDGESRLKNANKGGRVNRRPDVRILLEICR